jgi:hypothetical protein
MAALLEVGMESWCILIISVWVLPQDDLMCFSWKCSNYCVPSRLIEVEDLQGFVNLEA